MGTPLTSLLDSGWQLTLIILACVPFVAAGGYFQVSHLCECECECVCEFALICLFVCPEFIAM